MNALILAIKTLKPGSKFYFGKNSEGFQTLDIEHLVWLDSNQKQPTLDEINTEISYQETQQYKVARAAAYPSIADQLDLIYHEGIDAWKLTITAVKQEIPK
tara:strand:+ start:1080 stop:1382 length:303 start_codon:yes stop_codon:yes gene_type:complete